MCTIRYIVFQDRVKVKASELRKRVSRDNVEGRYREARDMARRIKHLAKEVFFSIIRMVGLKTSHKNSVDLAHG